MFHRLGEIVSCRYPENLKKPYIGKEQIDTDNPVYYGGRFVFAPQYALKAIRPHDFIVSHINEEKVWIQPGTGFRKITHGEGVQRGIRNRDYLKTTI